MRFLALVGFLFSWPALAQDLDINGYSTVMIPYADEHLFGAMAEIKEAVKAAGFEVIEVRDQVDPAAVGTTLLLGAAWDPPPARGQVMVIVFDIVTRAPVATSTQPIFDLLSMSSSAATRRVRYTARKLIEDLGYSGYDAAAYQRNQLAIQLARSNAEQSPPPETVPNPP
jgi:hypothetical protein